MNPYLKSIKEKMEGMEEALGETGAYYRKQFRAYQEMLEAMNARFGMLQENLSQIMQMNKESPIIASISIQADLSSAFASASSASSDTSFSFNAKTNGLDALFMAYNSYQEEFDFEIIESSEDRIKLNKKRKDTDERAEDPRDPKRQRQS